MNLNGTAQTTNTYVCPSQVTADGGVPASAIATAGHRLRHRHQSRHSGTGMYGSGGTLAETSSRHELHGELAFDAVPSCANELLLAGLGAGIDFLRCPHRRAVLDALVGDLAPAHVRARPECRSCRDSRSTRCARCGTACPSSRPVRWRRPRQTIRGTPSRSCWSRFPPARRSR